MTYSTYLLSFSEYKTKILMLAPIVFAIMLTMHQQLDGVNIFEQQLAFTKSRLIDVFQGYSSQQVKGVTLHFGLDNVYPITYSLLFSLVLAALIKQTGSEKRYGWIINLAPLAGIFDILENSCLIPFLNAIQEIPDWVVLLMSVSASIKWIFCILILATIGYLLLISLNNCRGVSNEAA